MKTTANLVFLKETLQNLSLLKKQALNTTPVSLWCSLRDLNSNTIKY